VNRLPRPHNAHYWSIRRDPDVVRRRWIDPRRLPGTDDPDGQDAMNTDEFARSLLPQPSSVSLQSDWLTIPVRTPIAVQIDEPRVERALLEWSRACGATPAIDNAAITLRATVDPASVGHPLASTLRIDCNAITIVGGSPAACFHAVQTLRQLSHREGAATSVPRGVIHDRPDFATRGLLHDVTRGKVPRLDTLKALVDRLAFLKINQLQLYIEHAFVFSFDPDICDEPNGLTAAEIRELDVYCRDRLIDLVPAVATFGHMGRILSLPRYRHLAEIEATRDWADLPWPQRARGYTLDCLNPESHRLVERIWTDILDAFSSRIVNICGDEPWDLGKGKNRDALASAGTGPAYLDQVRRTHDFCVARGRSTQFWSDVVRNHPDLFHMAPRESTVLHWGYDDRSDYAGTASLTNAGFKTLVCPGTSGWKRILNAIDLAERNIATFAAAGKQHGAVGLLNTDWGDHGHFNVLTCSWHAIALGAALGWRADHPTGPEFDRLFARTLMRTDDAAPIQRLRAASRLAERCETWRLFWIPRPDMASDPTLPTLAEIEETRVSARHARDSIRSLQREPFYASTSPSERGRTEIARGPFDDSPRFTSLEFAELGNALRFTELFCDRAIYAHQLRDTPRPGDTEMRPPPKWAVAVDDATRSYAEVWNARNKPSGLADIRRALTTVADEMRTGGPA